MSLKVLSNPNYCTVQYFSKWGVPPAFWYIHTILSISEGKNSFQNVEAEARRSTCKDSFSWELDMAQANEFLLPKIRKIRGHVTIIAKWKAHLLNLSSLETSETTSVLLAHKHIHMWAPAHTLSNTSPCILQKKTQIRKALLPVIFKSEYLDTNNH